VTVASTSGTTLSYQAPASLGSITINNRAGSVYDATAAVIEVAANTITMNQAWKYDASYKSLIKIYYYQSLYNISGINREVHPGQYGYYAVDWGLFPVSYKAGNQYTNYDAIHEWNS